METTQTNSNSADLKTALHPVIYRLFEHRGFSNEQIQEFFSSDLHKLPDLTDMKDLEKASNRIIEAINKKEVIGIYGDYDVDGTTSCALFWHFFKLLDLDVKLIQPSRFIEGYGLHISSIDDALEQGIQLLITVDCGITSHQAATYSKQKNLDLIITDHHKDASEALPEALAIVNPNRRDEPKESPLRALAGVAVAFAICLKTKQLLEKQGTKIPTIYPLLQFVAIGTICDVAFLNPTNIKLVRHGLRQLPKTKYEGLRTFLNKEEQELLSIPSEKLGFNIGPMINSKGRLDHPDRALRLLISDNHEEAFDHYSHLEICNKERKFIQGGVVKEAKDQIISQIREGDHLISIAYSPEWHEGVIGIVASRLVDTFKVPAIIFTDSEDEGLIKASARSVKGLDIFSLLKNCDSLFTKFGGHKAAAGLSMPKENLEKFRFMMNEQLDAIPAIERTADQDFYDLEISAKEINAKLLKQLETLEPYGMGNQKPVFKMKDFTLESFDMLKEVHVRWNLKGIDSNQFIKGITFNYTDKWGVMSPEDLFQAQNQRNEQLECYFTLAINRFRGAEYIQLMIDKIQVC